MEKKQNMDKKHNVEQKSSMEPKQNVVQKSIMEPKHNVEQKSSMGPKQNVEQKSRMEPKQNVEQKSSMGPKQNVEQKSSVGQKQNVEQKSSVEPKQNVEQKSSMEPKQNVEQKSSMGQKQNVEQKSSVEPKQNVEQKSSVEPKQNVQQKSSVEPKQNVEQKSSVEPKQNVEQKSSMEPKQNVEQKSRMEPKYNEELKQNVEQKLSMEQKTNMEQKNTKSQSTNEPSNVQKLSQKFGQSRLSRFPNNDPVPSSNLGKSIGSCEVNTVTARSATGLQRPLTLMPNSQGRAIVKLSQPDHIKKVAIISTDEKLTLFFEIDQNLPLEAIVQDICDRWSLPNKDECALQFSEPSRHYITNRNRSEIQNGNVLTLTDSPGKVVLQVMEKLSKGGREDKIETLKHLPAMLTDVTFAMEFTDRGGDKIIVDNIVAGNKSFSGEPVGYLLRSFVELMKHNVISLDNLSQEVTKQVAFCISGTSTIIHNCIQPALEILEAIILQGTNSSKLDFVEQYISPDRVISYIQSKYCEIQESALALINAMFMMSSADKKQKLAESLQRKEFRMLIMNIVTTLPCSNSGLELAHQLYKLQRLLFNMYEARLKQGLDLADNAKVTAVNKLIEELRQMAFDFTDFADHNTNTTRKSTAAKDYCKLGFQNKVDPVTDFDEGPGLLALDNVLYFARCHKESYVKVVLENCGRDNEQDCPFMQASIQLTKILCQLLKIGEDPYEDEHAFVPMFFTVEKPFEEFFCSCIQLMNRTWKEMRASKDDFSKVLSVVSEQITRALDKNQMPLTFEMFRTKLGQLAHPELKKIWEAERQKKDESKSQSAPILELRDLLKTELQELICKHRLMNLEGGSRFPKYENKNRMKSKYQYWRLSANHKAFHFGDCGEKDEPPSIEQLPNKINVTDIQKLITGKDCPHTSKKIQSELIFSLVLETGTGQSDDQCPMYHFIADSEQEYMIWEDGINALLGGVDKMKSKQAMEDLETLLNMEIKLQLLETDGVAIPMEPPVIPPLPEHFNFVYSFT